MKINSIILLGIVLISGCNLKTQELSNQKSMKDQFNFSPTKTMSDFGIDASNLFLYYKDLEKASAFYSNILGLEEIADYEMAKIFRIASESYLVLVDAERGMHTADEPKTVALALITDQLDEWYNYIKSTDIEIKYDYKPKEGGPHDGFVIYDPEGYLLEFERFKTHDENIKFIPILDQCKTLISSSTTSNNFPENLGFKASVTWLYYKDLELMQKFYEKVLGLEFIVDQGWTKIYKVSNSGFIGLVDEKKGMHKFTEEKAVNVSFLIRDIDQWFDFVSQNKLFPLRSDQMELGPENKYKAFVGFDPGGYFMEFDRFNAHKSNEILLKYLSEEK